MNAGENFYLKLWDSSSDVIIDYSDGFDCWYNNNGAPMTGCGSVINIYDFVPAVVIGPSAGFNFVVDGLTVQLIDESVPGDNTIVSWSWDFGDGNSSSSQNPVHVYSASGTYDVTLLVTDAADMSDSISGMVTVTDDESQEVVHIVYYTPESDYNGDDSFGYRVFDGMEQSDEATVSITISPVNDAPELVFINDQTTPEDSELVLTLSASDVDGDNLIYTAESSEENVQVTMSSDVLTLSPAGDWNGSSTILATVTDGELTDSQAFVVTVTPVDDAPEMSDIPDQEIMEGEAFTSFDLDDYVTEVDGDVVDWSYSSGSDEVSGFVHHIMLSGEGSDYDLGFGFLEGATDGYDEGIDFYAPPAPPSGFDAALAWNFERYYTQVLSFDGDYSEHVWDIQLQYPADNLIELKTVCDCGRKAIMVVRLDEKGKVVKDGDQIKIGGNDSYKVFCRKHFRELTHLI